MSFHVRPDVGRGDRDSLGDAPKARSGEATSVVDIPLAPDLFRDRGPMRTQGQCERCAALERERRQHRPSGDGDTGDGGGDVLCLMCGFEQQRQRQDLLTAFAWLVVKVMPADSQIVAEATLALGENEAGDR